jgi:acetyl-CoA carboxylase carboxyltransferase component
MGPDAAADVVFRRELADASNPAELRRSLSQRYTEELTHPYYAAECGYVDDVIDPADTRRALVEGLDMLRTKRTERPWRKHGNPPL